MLTHTDAKIVLQSVAPELSLAERLVAQGISLHETSYGSGWKEGHGAGSHNWGAITTTSKNPADYFESQDSTPTNTYQGHFKVYPDDGAGALDVVKVGLKQNVRDAAARGDLQLVAQGMFDNHYYTGVSLDPATNVRRYRDALADAISQITAETGEANPFAPKVSPGQPSQSSDLPRLSLGSVGSGVQLLSALIGSKIVGAFDVELHLAVRKFQAKKGLAIDGVVGPKTWTALIVAADPVK